MTAPGIDVATVGDANGKADVCTESERVSGMGANMNGTAKANGAPAPKGGPRPAAAPANDAAPESGSVVDVEGAKALTDESIDAGAQLSDRDFERAKKALTAAGLTTKDVDAWASLVRSARRGREQAIAAAEKAKRDATAKSARAGTRELKRGDHPDLARVLLRELKSDAAVISDLGSLHTYCSKRGIWEKVQRPTASVIVQSLAGATITGLGQPKTLTLRVNDISGAILLANDVASRVGFFDSAAPGLAFANAFVNVVAGEIVKSEHSPKHAARYAYPFALDAAAPCERWLRTLADAFEGDADAKEKIACLQEFAGASLFGVAAKHQRAIVLSGEGANAKSVIGTVLAAAMPPGSTCSVAPQAWGNEYRRALMADKLLNVVSELPEADIVSSEPVKAMIDGSSMEARHIRESVFEFHPKAGHLLNANRLPATADHTHGFWRRFIVLVFNRVFEVHEQNVNLASEIIRDELPGVVAWMVEGARRLMTQGRYTVPSSSTSAVSEWRRGADPVAQFIEEETEPAASHLDRTKTSIVFTAYVRWAERNRFKVMSSNSFGRRMRGLKLGSERSHGAVDVYPIALRQREGDEEVTGFGRAGVGAPPEPPPAAPPEPGSIDAIADAIALDAIRRIDSAPVAEVDSVVAEYERQLCGPQRAARLARIRARAADRKRGASKLQPATLKRGAP